MKLYFKYAGILLKSQMQYKTSFIMTTVGQFLVSFTAFLGIYFMFTRFHSVNGFTFSEILLCFSIVLMAFSITECLVRGFDVFPQLIQSGKLDRILVRPRNEIFQVLTSNMEFSRVGRLLQSILMLAYGIPKSGILWTADKVAALVFMVIGGIAGGTIGSRINKKIKEEDVDKLFMFLMVVIVLINVYNVVRFGRAL